MRIAVNAYLPKDRIGYVPREVLEAVAVVHASLGHHRSLDEGGLPLGKISEFGSVGAFVDASLDGKAVGEVSFEVHEAPSDHGVDDPKLFLAMAQIYGWREYCWHDMDLEQAEHGLRGDECVADFVEDLAKDFDLSEVDDMTRRAADQKGFIAPAASQPASRLGR